MTELRNPTPEIDPKNGFEIAWKSGAETKNTYTLVRVPTIIPVRILYTKELSELDYSIQTPDENSSDWLIKGIINTEVMTSLGLPLANRITGPNRSRKTQVSQEDLETMKRYGSFRQLDEYTFDVNMGLSPWRIDRYLRETWKPLALVGKGFDNRPGFNIEAQNGTDRLLPQKEPYRADESYLLVQKI